MIKKEHLKVAMIGTSTETKGGISTAVNQLLASSLIDHFDIRYIVTHCDGSNINKAQKAVYGFIAYLLCLINYMPDIVHIHCASRASFYRKSLFIITAKMFHKKVIFHLHGAEFMLFYERESGNIKQKFIQYILKKADLVIALSNSWGNYLQSILPELPIKVLPNSILIPEQVYQATKGVPSIIFLGRVGKRKGLPDLMAAVEILKSRKLRFHCIICGDGAIEYWTEQCANRGLANEFVFKGWVKNTLKHELLCKSDIFVLPSYNEGVPMSVLEAMSYGVPVIVSNVGGIPEIITNGVNGYMIEPGDVQSFAAKLERLLMDGELRERIGMKGKETIIEKFNVKKSVQQLKIIYEALL